MARPRAQDYDQKRSSICKTATQLFAAQGFDRTSIASVAAACGVSKALLYHYYDSKEALLFDIISLHLEELNQALEAADDPALPPDRRLRLLIGALLEAYRDADDEHRVQIAAMPTLPPDLVEELRALERLLVGRFAKVLLAVNPALEAQPGYLKPVTMSLFGMLNWVYLWFRPDGAISREDYADLATTMILEGVKAVGKGEN
ncbi:MAG: TetR/AcrR family transcriptional regulator [Rhodospirillales bacterium]